jgi:hypothetical protein
VGGFLVRMYLTGGGKKVLLGAIVKGGFKTKYNIIERLWLNKGI